MAGCTTVEVLARQTVSGEIDHQCLPQSNAQTLRKRVMCRPCAGSRALHILFGGGSADSDRTYNLIMEDDRNSTAVNGVASSSAAVETEQRLSGLREFAKFVSRDAICDSGVCLIDGERGSRDLGTVHAKKRL